MEVRIAMLDGVEFDSHSEVGKTRVLAKGQVNTGGWTGVRLIPTTADPKDLFIDLDLVGTPPTGIVSQGFVHVNASLLIEKGGNIGVTVHAANNQIRKTFT